MNPPKESIQRLINKLWVTELKNARAQNDFIDENHIFYHLVEASNWVNDRTDDFREVVYGENAIFSLPCTLDGKPAKITGHNHAFATVSTLDGMQSYQWSWDAVRKVMKKDGKFKS